jgi:hypothetical protein
LKPVLEYDPDSGEAWIGFERRDRQVPAEQPVPPQEADEEEVEPPPERRRSTTSAQIKESIKPKLRVEVEGRPKPKPAKPQASPVEPSQAEAPTPQPQPEPEDGGSVTGTVKDSVPPPYAPNILFERTDPWHPVATFADPSYVAHIAVVTAIMTGDPTLEVTIEGSVGYVNAIQKRMYDALGKGPGPLMDARAAKVEAELIRAGVPPHRIHTSRGSAGFGPANRSVQFKFFRK